MAPRRSFSTEVVQSVAEKVRRFQRESRKRGAAPPFMEEEYTPSEYRRKALAPENEEFRRREIERLGPDGFARALRGR